MTTTINYTVLKIQEIQDKTTGLAHNNIFYETIEFSFRKPLSEKKYLTYNNIKDHIELKGYYNTPSTGNFSNLFEWHLN